MSRPNAQYPRGKKSMEKQDDAVYNEEKERLENQDKEDAIPKRNKH